jgi:hypothetical protein
LAVRSFENKHLNRERLRVILIIMLTLLGIIALVEVLTAFTPAIGLSFNLENLILGGMTRGEIRSAIGAIWFFNHIALKTIVAILAMFSAGLIIIGREKWGVGLGIVVVVLSLTMINLLSFFVNQFSASVDALIQLLVFLALTHYRSRYLH